MPRFNALEIDVSLAVTSLQQTLSNNIQLRMGSDQKKDAVRIDAALRGGRKLLERPVRDSEVGILQHLGADGDMTFLVAEAGDGVHASSGAAESSGFVESSVGETDDSGHQSTNLGSTVFDDNTQTPDGSFASAPTPRRVTSKTQTTSGGKTTPAPPTRLLEQRRLPLSDRIEEQALSICISFSDKTFLRRERAVTTTGKDLKFEIYVNGDFANLTYVSARRSGATAKKINGGIENFTGKRFHRQAERPWIYEHVADGNELPQVDGDQRWAAIQAALTHEAGVRGVDKYGQRSFTDDFLLALAKLDVPEHLKPKGARIGVIDIIITAGNGWKFGPDSAYVGIPTRMDNRKYSNGKGSNDKVDLPPTVKGRSSTSRSSPTSSTMKPVLPTSSPDQPKARRSSTISVLDPQLRSEPSAPSRVRRSLTASAIDSQLLPECLEIPEARQTSTTSVIDPELLPDGPAIPQTRPAESKRRAQSFELVPTEATEQHGSETYNAVKIAPLQKYIDKYENAHGRERGKRTMRQRMGDLRKMSPEKKKTVLREMRSQLSEQDMAIIMEDLEVDADALIESPSKKVRFKSPVIGPDPDAEADLFADANLPLSPTLQPMLREQTPNFAELFAAQESTMYDSSMLMSRYEHIDPRLLSLHPYNSAPEPAVVQQRVDLARELGASESGALLQRLSPVRPRKTAASSLSHGPIELGVKKHGNARKKTALSVVPVDLTGPLPASSPRRKAPTPKKGETLVDNAQEEFKVPHLSQGRAVGYAAAGVQRQVPKIRGGEFNEEEFLVGMRFYVW